jgi:hypothetical protein
MAKNFNPDCDHIGDLIETVQPPTDEQIKVGIMALDYYYEGKKDPDFEGSVALVYRAMRALEA